MGDRIAPSLHESWGSCAVAFLINAGFGFLQKHIIVGAGGVLPSCKELMDWVSWF